MKWSEAIAGTVGYICFTVVLCSISHCTYKTAEAKNGKNVEKDERTYSEGVIDGFNTMKSNACQAKSIEDLKYVWCHKE